jgi:hypothetical protein
VALRERRRVPRVQEMAEEVDWLVAAARGGADADLIPAPTILTSAAASLQPLPRLRDRGPLPRLARRPLIARRVPDHGGAGPSAQVQDLAGGEHRPAGLLELLAADEPVADTVVQPCPGGQPEAANLFFQLVSARYERASLIVTSNKPFGRWGETFGDEVVAAAMIDRLVHHAEVIALKGDSYRLKDRDLGRIPAANPTDD